MDQFSRNATHEEWIHRLAVSPARPSHGRAPGGSGVGPGRILAGSWAGPGKVLGRNALGSRKVEDVNFQLHVTDFLSATMTDVELVEASPRRLGPWPPKASRLELGTPHWICSQGAAFDGPSQLSCEAAAAKQMALKRHRRPKSCTPAGPNVEPFFQGTPNVEPQPLFKPLKKPTPFACGGLAVLSSRQQVRQRHPKERSGGDPLAGNPFSKDAQLDPLCQTLGMYDAQWVRHSRRFAVSVDIASNKKDVQTSGAKLLVGRGAAELECHSAAAELECNDPQLIFPTSTVQHTATTDGVSGIRRPASQ